MSLHSQFVLCVPYIVLLLVLLVIYKIWGFTTYTSDYSFALNDISNNEIIVNFSKLTFEEFSSYWRLHKGFRELAPFNYDYDMTILCKFINYFVYKYTHITGFSYLGINPSIVDYLKIEAYEIFENLAKYSDDDKKYFENIRTEIDNKEIDISSKNKAFRKIIKFYLECNNN